MIVAKKSCVVNAAASLTMLSVFGLSGCAGSLPKLPAVAPNAVTTSIPAPATAQVNGTPSTATNANEKIIQPETTNRKPSLTVQERSATRAADHAITRDTRITSFRASSVVLYYSKTGSHGERIAVSNLSLPMSIKFHSSSAKRIEIAMPAGSRWIDDKAVILAERPSSTPTR
jgi:hypothetical protein